jgi:hypothetical protein
VEPAYTAPPYAETRKISAGAALNGTVTGVKRMIVIVAENPGMAPNTIPIPTPRNIAARRNGSASTVAPERIDRIPTEIMVAVPTAIQQTLPRSVK